MAAHLPTVRRGAWCDAGGSTPDGAGFFYTPTVMTDVPPGAPALTEVIFGPAMPVIPFDEAPFGGMKRSGLGREAGHECLLGHLEPKTRLIGVSY